MKKNAFSLFEMLIVMILISMVMIVLIRSIHGLKLNDKQNAATVHKILSEFSQISANALTKDSTHFPTGRYFQDVLGTYEYMAVDGSRQPLSAQGVLDALGNYAKFKRTNIDFCQNTDCSVLGLEEGQEVAGVRWFGDAYVGISVNTNASNNSVEIVDCPQYVLPEFDEPVTPRRTSEDGEMGTAAKCWARLFVDTNGNNPPNELGNDIFAFGIGETDIAK